MFIADPPISLLPPTYRQWYSLSPSLPVTSALDSSVASTLPLSLPEASEEVRIVDLAKPKLGSLHSPDDEWSQYTVAQLKLACKEMGLKAAGTRDVLLKRLQEATQAVAETSNSQA